MGYVVVEAAPAVVDADPDARTTLPIGYGSGWRSRTIAASAIGRKSMPLAAATARSDPGSMTFGVFSGFVRRCGWGMVPAIGERPRAASLASTPAPVIVSSPACGGRTLINLQGGQQMHRKYLHHVEGLCCALRWCPIDHDRSFGEAAGRAARVSIYTRRS